MLLCNLWGLWILVTLGDFFTLYGDGGSEYSLYYIPNSLFNLFTPMLVANSWFAFRKMTLPLMLLVLFVGNRIGSKIQVAALRVPYNLVVLLLLTAAVDYITWGKWPSGERVADIINTWPASLPDLRSHPHVTSHLVDPPPHK